MLRQVVCSSAALLGEGHSTHWELEKEIGGEGNLPVLSLFL